MASNIPTVQAIYRAFGAGDVPAILSHLDPEVEWEHDWGIEPLPIFAARKGRDAVPAFFEGLSAIDIWRFEPVNLLEGGNQVVAVIRLGATARKSGIAVNDLEAHLWTFGADGRVTGFRHLCDTRQFERALA